MHRKEGVAILQHPLMTESMGFEPTVPCGTRLFESRTLNHSDNSPNLRLLYFSGKNSCLQPYYIFIGIILSIFCNEKVVVTFKIG